MFFDVVVDDDDDISDASVKFTTGSSCFALRINNELVSTFCVSRSG